MEGAQAKITAYLEANKTQFIVRIVLGNYKVQSNVIIKKSDNAVLQYI